MVISMRWVIAHRKVKRASPEESRVWRSRNLHHHRAIKIASAICERAQAWNEILFSGVGWIATYISLTRLDDLTATLIEVSIARDMN
jgi:hypothetical protein